MDTAEKEILLRDIQLDPKDLYNQIGILDPEGNNLNPLNINLIQLFIETKVYQQVKVKDGQHYLCI